jgi:phosphoribosylglycinamide formyltransferase 1
LTGLSGGAMWENSGPMPFVILGSGAGTNARALLSFAADNPQLVQATAVVSDRPDAPVLDVAKEFGIPAHMIPHREESALLDLLAEGGCHWACLAGYRRIVGEGFLNFFSVGSRGFSRVLNVHPSLLPAYPGLGGYERAYRDGVRLSGVTVHLVDSGLDTGPTVLQESFRRDESDTPEAFEAKGRALERKLYPQALELAARNRIRVRDVHGSRWVSLEVE